MGWITRLAIDLHRHLAGQRFEAKLASNEIDFADSGISKAALSDALERLMAARKLLLELTDVFRKFGSTNVGEADDYQYLQQLLDQALGQPVMCCCVPCAHLLYRSVVCCLCIAQLGRQTFSMPCHQNKMMNRRGLAVPRVSSESERGARPQTIKSPRPSVLVAQANHCCSTVDFTRTLHVSFTLHQ